MSSPTSMPPSQFGDLQLASLQKLTFDAPTHSQEVIWRALDVSLVAFEILQIFPPSERAKYYIVAANACKAVLMNVRKVGQRRMTNDETRKLNNIINVVEIMTVQAKNEDAFVRHFNTLRNIIKEHATSSAIIRVENDDTRSDIASSPESEHIRINSPHEPTKSSVTRRILVIDGGGIRGLAALMIIDAIMKTITTRARRHLLPCDVFDLIGGTSVGGLLSILLGRLRLDCATAKKYYEEAMSILLQGQGDKIWDNIVKQDFIDTSGFHEYLRKIVADSLGSPDVPVNNVNLDPHRPLGAKTFIPVMEVGPHYPTHPEIIRSYVPQNLDTLLPTGRCWTIPEAVVVAMASPIYILPRSIEEDVQRNFQDAGFSGYNNPTELALEEFRNNWPGECADTIVSLGTGLRGFLPDTPPSSWDKWAPTPQYVNEVCRKLVHGKLSSLLRHDSIDRNIARAVRDQVCIAADSSIVHRQVGANRAAHCGNYFRIDEPFGLGPFDLVDVSQSTVVEESVNKWLAREGVDLIAKIANALVPKDINSCPSTPISCPSTPLLRTPTSLRYAQ